MTNRKAHKNGPHSALFKSSRRYQSIVSYGLIILVFNFSDIKRSLVKIIYYLPYTPKKTNNNVKKYATHLWCGADRVWGAALCQKVQGHFLAPVRPCLLLSTKCWKNTDCKKAGLTNQWTCSSKNTFANLQASDSGLLDFPLKSRLGCVLYSISSGII